MSLYDIDEDKPDTSSTRLFLPNGDEKPKALTSIIGSDLHTYLKRKQHCKDTYTLEEKAMWTHLIMSGEIGGFTIPHQLDDYDRFWFWYVYDIETNYQKHYISERRSPIFKFHADFDIKRENALTREEVMTLSQDLALTVRMFYPPTTSANRFDLIVSAVVKPHKSGIHVIFPNLYVTDQEAMEIRGLFVVRLIEKYGEMRGVQNAWEDIVDASIYGPNGFRMMFSHKATPCPQCHGGKIKYSRDQSCPLCNGWKKVDVGRAYRPWFYLKNQDPQPVEDVTWTQHLRGSLNQVVLHYGKRRRLIEMCSTVSFHTHSSSDFTSRTGPVWRKPQSVKPIPSGSISPRQSFKTLQIGEVNHTVLAEDYSSMVRRKTHVDIGETKIQLLQHYFKSSTFPEPWRKLYIYNVTTNSNQTYYIINVKGDGCHYCLNYELENHKSNSIYFLVKDGFISQRCYCRCHTTLHRRSGQMCSEFTSEPMPLPDEVNAALFPKSSRSKMKSLTQNRSETLSEFTYKLASTVAELKKADTEYMIQRQQRLQDKKQGKAVSDPPQEAKLRPTKRRKTKD